METPPLHPEPTRMMTRSVLAEIPTRLGRLSMTDPNGIFIYNVCLKNLGATLICRLQMHAVYILQS